MDTTLGWALNAKNSFIYVIGFTPHQLVFGKNVNLPSAMNDQLSAGYSTNPLIIEHLKALHTAQESFMKTESSAKLRNALRKQTRHTREHFDLGQAMYCKCNNDIKWKDPGKIVDQDGSVVFLRHGGFYLKVHCSKIQIGSDSGDEQYSINMKETSFDNINKDNVS